MTPSLEELAEGKVTEGSYLVAFRGMTTQRQGESLNGAVVRQKTLGLITNDLFPQRGVKQFSLLGNLNLSHPSKSFSTSWALEGPRGLQLNFQNPNNDMAAITRVDFNTKEEAELTLKRWLDDGVIWYAEPNYISHPNGELEDDIINNFSSADTYPWLAQINYINAIQYYSANPPVESPVIAVLDSGVDVLHPALSSNIYINDDGQNKLCVDDLYGCDTTVNKKDILGKGTVYPAGTSGFQQPCVSEQSNCAHGTHVTGIIAARDPSYIGICPYCRVLVVKVVGIKVRDGKESFQIEDSAIIAGLAYVSGFTIGGEPLVRVINASFGKFQKSRSVGLFIESLKTFGKGILTVAAAGNEDTMKRQYPAAFEDVIAVSSVNSSTQEPTKAPSSNFGMWVDIAAPGSGNCSLGAGILSSVPGGLASCNEGTSMASPVVAGVAGLVLARNPELSYGELRSRVLASAIPDNLYRDGVNNAYRPKVGGKELVPLLGGGVVNALAAVDPSIEKTDPILTEKRDAVGPGCGVIGGYEAGFGGLILILLGPALLKLKGLFKQKVRMFEQE